MAHAPPAACPCSLDGASCFDTDHCTAGLEGEAGLAFGVQPEPEASLLGP